MTTVMHGVERMDDATIGAFERQLEVVEKQVIQVQYPELKAAGGKLIKIEVMNAEWADQTTFRIQDIVGGDFDLSEDNTTNLTLVDFSREERTQRIYEFRKGYECTRKEILRAARQGMPIEQQKIRALNFSYKQTLNKLILRGHPSAGIPGLLNHNAWLRIDAPYSLDASSSEAQMLATLNAGVNAIISATNAIHQPDTLLLAKRTYDYLISQAHWLNSGTNETVLKFFLKNNPSIRNIDWLLELQGAGPNGEDAAFFYKRSPMTMIARITSPMKFFQLIRRPFSVIRAAGFDYNGVIPYQPYSACLMLGV